MSKAHVSSSEQTSYVYDAQDRLRRVVLPDSTQIDYVHDALGRRVGKVVDGSLVYGLRYGTDSLRPLARLDGSGVIESTYVYGTRVNVPELIVQRATGAVYRVITDHLGSVRLVVEVATGAVAQRMDYDEFGVVLTDTNPGFQPFGFAGGLYDADTGLVRFGARDYDAAVGRWTSKDPALFGGADANLYRYAAGDPINKRDATGNMWTPAEGGEGFEGSAYNCRSTLQALGAWGYGFFSNDWPLLFHEFWCTEENGITTCGGQTPSGSPLGSPGASGGNTPSDPFTVCEERPSSGCFNDCMNQGFGGGRPFYGVVGPGTNCQEWAGDLEARCRAACP